MAQHPVMASGLFTRSTQSSRPQSHHHNVFVRQDRAIVLFIDLSIYIPICLHPKYKAHAQRTSPTKPPRTKPPKPYISSLNRQRYTTTIPQPKNIQSSTPNPSHISKMSNPQSKSKHPSLAGRATSFFCGAPKKAPSPPPPRLASSSIPLRRMYTHENNHLPSVPASTIAASHPGSSRVSGWWNMYDEITGGPLPSTSEFVDVDLEAGPSAVSTVGPSQPRQQQQQQQQQRPAEPQPEPETAPSREGSIHSIDFFNGRVIGRADPKDKGEGKNKEQPQRPARRQGAGVFEA